MVDTVFRAEVDPLPAPAITSLAPTTSPKRTPENALKRLDVIAMTVVAGSVVAASYLKWWSIPVTEAWGFATGGVCVWLVVREHVANWPIGLINNAVFFVLFLRSRLFADMGLQVVYFVLGAYGWWHWVYGGQNRTPLKISRTKPREWIAVLLSTLAGTWVLHEILLRVNGAAPFWDSVTTGLSLAAQYLLCRKRLENWLLWILADVIYVPLYLSRGLILTGALYGVFLVMCLIGLREWREHVRREGSVA